MIEVHSTISGHKRIDFDRKKVRRGMRTIGAEIRKDARRLVARRAVSRAGEYPGRDTGTLHRSIRARVSKSGFMVRIAPDKTSDMKDFYPAYLGYGTSTGVAKRGNYPADALENKRDRVRGVLQGVLLDSLKPR